MTEHRCLHENWWGELKSDVGKIKDDIGDIKAKLNGKDGVIVQTQLNKSSLSRVWYFVGAIALLFLGTGVKAWFF